MGRGFDLASKTHSASQTNPNPVFTLMFAMAGEAAKLEKSLSTSSRNLFLAKLGVAFTSRRRGSSNTSINGPLKRKD